MVKLIKVPKSEFKQVGPAEDVHKIMNDFFINTKDYVQDNLNNANNFDFNIKYANLAYNSDQVNSDDKLIYLEFKEKYAVAGMLETRTAFNDMQFTFFRNLSFLKNKIM